MIDLIITDIGGVLIKTDEAIISSIRRLVREKGIPDGSVEALHRVLGVSIEDYIRAYLPKGYKDSTGECYEHFKKIYPQQVLHLLEPFEGVDDTLEYLKSHGIRLAVLSCMHRDEVEANLSILKFESFDAKFSIEDYGENYKRPDPKGLLMLMEFLHANPKKTMYVGDTHNDVQMAKNAKVISVAIKTGAQNNIYLENANPDHLIDRFCDIPTKILPSYTDAR